MFLVPIIIPTFRFSHSKIFPQFLVPKCFLSPLLILHIKCLFGCAAATHVLLEIIVMTCISSRV